MSDLYGKAVIVTGDRAFEGAFTDDADSSWPLAIMTFRNGGFANVTSKYPQQVRDDATQQWSAYRKLYADGRGTAGVLAQWTADECVINRGKYAWLTLHQLLREKRITSIDRTATVDAPTYLSKLAALLHEQGYCTGQTLSG
jgi:hypothetical protein